MQTLTITDAKKNLGKWLRAAAAGAEVAIVSGADIVALRKIPVQPADYPHREYGVTEAELDRFAETAEALVGRHRAAGTLAQHAADTAALLEKTSHHPAARARKSRRPA